jgi:hypothetical protein
VRDDHLDLLMGVCPARRSLGRSTEDVARPSTRPTGARSPRATSDCSRGTPRAETRSDELARRGPVVRPHAPSASGQSGSGQSASPRPSPTSRG